MNKTLFSILSAVVLLNTACSPKQETGSTSTTATSSSAQHSVAASTQALAVVSSAATITPAATPSPTNGELLNTYWKLTLLNDAEVTVSDNQREAHITFNTEGGVSGSDGCNRITGSYLLNGNTLTLDEMAGTKMACAEGGEQTQAFNTALTKVATYSVQGEQLELRDAADVVIARFKAVALP